MAITRLSQGFADTGKNPFHEHALLPGYGLEFFHPSLLMSRDPNVNPQNDQI
jgi:hypothetical protein